MDIQQYGTDDPLKTKSVFTGSQIFPDHLLRRFRKNALWTDRQTDRLTDAKTHLKSYLTNLKILGAQ